MVKNIEKIWKETLYYLLLLLRNFEVDLRSSGEGKDGRGEIVEKSKK